MQRQSRHEKEKYEHDAEFDEKHQDQSSEFSFVDLEEICRPRHRRVPKHGCRSEIEQGEYEADDKCAEEKVPEENDFLVFHGAHYLFQKGQINNKWLRQVDSLNR
jgi:hypothetical protein